MKKTLGLLLFIMLLGVLGFTPSASLALRLTEATRSLHYAPSAGDTDRLDTILAETYTAASKRPLFQGDSAIEATALLLYAVMYHESGLRPHIEHCDCTRGDGDCDKGHAFGLPQLHAEWFQGHPRDEVCSNRTLQVELAMDLLAKEKKFCGGSPRHWVAGYHAGNSCVALGYASNVDGVFRTLLSRAQIRIAPNGKGWTAIAQPQD